MSNENHNHVTRAIKEPGECYGCDRYWATHSAKIITALRNAIYGTLDSWEDFGAAHAHSYLTQVAQTHNINRYEDD